jgi:hypothetical protein
MVDGTTDDSLQVELGSSQHINPIEEQKKLEKQSVPMSMDLDYSTLNKNPYEDLLKKTVNALMAATDPNSTAWKTVAVKGNFFVLGTLIYFRGRFGLKKRTCKW